MNRNLFSSIFFFFLWSFASQAQQDSTWSLQECITYAVQHQPELQRSQLDVERNDLNYKQSKYNLLPNLNANINYSINNGRSIDPTTNAFVEQTITSAGPGVVAGLPIFNGLKILNEIRANSSALKAGKLEFDGLVNQLKLDVITSYIKVWTAHDMLVQSQQQLEVTKERLRNAEVMHREGAFAPGDYYDIKGEYSVNMNTVENNKQALNSSKAELARWMNLSLEDLPSLERLEIVAYQPIDAHELYNLSKQTLPQFQAWQWRIQEAEKRVNVEKSAYFPQLSLDAWYDTRYSSGNSFSFSNQIRDNRSNGLGLYLRIPIFNRMQIRTNVRTAKLMVEDVLRQEEMALNELRENTAKAVFDLKTASINVKNLENQEADYAEAFRIAQVQFDLGSINSVFYLTAKNKLENTQNQLVIKRYEWMLQKFINDFYSGTLK